MESLQARYLEKYDHLLQEEDEIYLFLQRKIERKPPKEVDLMEKGKHGIKRERGLVPQIVETVCS